MDTQSLKITLQTVWIRLRGWMRLVTQLGSIGMFLLGVLAVHQARTPQGHLNATLLGYDVPALLGFTAHETMLYGGIVVMMLGLGLAYRWIVSDRTGYATY